MKRGAFNPRDGRRRPLPLAPPLVRAGRNARRRSPATNSQNIFFRKLFAGVFFKILQACSPPLPRIREGNSRGFFFPGIPFPLICPSRRPPSVRQQHPPHSRPSRAPLCAVRRSQPRALHSPVQLTPSPAWRRREAQEKGSDNPSNAGGGDWGVECARRVRAGKYPPRTFPARQGRFSRGSRGAGSPPSASAWPAEIRSRRGVRIPQMP